MPTDPKATSVDICVCTFRRPELAVALRSLDAIDIPQGYRVGIIVADNDDVSSAERLVAQVGSELKLPIRYVHAPARNISIARNACLDASEAGLVAFIDDDETVTPNWLVNLIEAARSSGADAVLGPVRARYGSDVPRWMSNGDFHSTFPVVVRGQIRTGYTCNVLLRMGSKSISGRRFSPARGQSGGEDTEFFDAMHGAGGMIDFAPEAWVEEVVPADRATFGWLARRRFRVGQTHGHLLANKTTGFGVVRELAVATAKVGYSFVFAGLTVFRPTDRNRSLLRAVMHAGVMSGLLGVRELRQYGSDGYSDGGARAT